MYTEQLGQAMFPSGTGVLGIEAIDAAPGVHGEYLAAKRVHIKRIMFIVTVLVAADATAPVVRFSRRPTPGSDTDVAVIGTLTIPDGTAVGKVLYKEVDVVLNAGEALKLENTVQGVDGSSVAGDGFYMFELDDCPEEAAENSDMVASA